MRARLDRPRASIGPMAYRTRAGRLAGQGTRNLLRSCDQVEHEANLRNAISPRCRKRRSQYCPASATFRRQRLLTSWPRLAETSSSHTRRRLMNRKCAVHAHRQGRPLCTIAAIRRRRAERSIDLERTFCWEGKLLVEDLVNDPIAACFGYFLKRRGNVPQVPADRHVQGRATERHEKSFLSSG